jgi:hypothetical protein
MSQEWQVATKKATAGSQTHLPSGPLTKQTGKFLGRLIIEAFEPDDRSSDGIVMEIDSGPGTAAGDLQFARDVIGKLNARFQRLK